MIAIEVSPTVAAKVFLLAKAWKVSPGVAIQRLVEEFEADAFGGADAASAAGPGAGRLDVHAEYQGTRVTGVYDRADRSVTITSGPCEGQRFGTPSAAAIAVVSKVNPRVSPNRNGWDFWIVDDSGERLHSVRH